MRIRDNGFMMYLSDEEMRVFKEKAEFVRMSKSDYLRTLMLLSNPIIRDPLQNIDAKMLAIILNGIGDKINEIARRSNKRRTVTEDDYIKLKEEYENLFESYVEFVLEAE